MTPGDLKHDSSWPLSWLPVTRQDPSCTGHLRPTWPPVTWLDLATGHPTDHTIIWKAPLPLPCPVWQGFKEGQTLKKVCSKDFYRILSNPPSSPHVLCCLKNGLENWPTDVWSWKLTSLSNLTPRLQVYTLTLPRDLPRPDPAFGPRRNNDPTTWPPPRPREGDTGLGKIDHGEVTFLIWGRKNKI